MSWLYKIKEQCCLQGLTSDSSDASLSNKSEEIIKSQVVELWLNHGRVTIKIQVETFSGTFKVIIQLKKQTGKSFLHLFQEVMTEAMGLGRQSEAEEAKYCKCMIFLNCKSETHHTYPSLKVLWDSWIPLRYIWSLPNPSGWSLLLLHLIPHRLLSPLVLS